MKVLHYMRKSPFVHDVTKFYDTYFPDGEHEICYVIGKDAESLINPAFAIPQRELRVTFKRRCLWDTARLVSLMQKYDYVVVHGMFLNLSTRLYLALSRKLCKKIVWIAWGYDLYRPETDKKARLNDRLHTRLKNNIGTFVGIFPTDCDYFKSHFPDAQAKIYFATYCSATSDPAYAVYSPESRLCQTKKNGEPFYIQIGHNGATSLHHMDVLRVLSKWSGENIRIVLVLAYGIPGQIGAQEYIDQIQQLAEKLFPGKVICQREMLPMAEYYERMRRVDIAIFNTHRQCGLGNINRMAFKNVKLYVNQDCVMYPYFIEQGVPIQRYEDIENLSFEEFISPVEPEDPVRFRQFTDTVFNIDYRAGMWKKIFEDLRKRLKQ